MVKGTLLIIGPKDREAELFAARLEREHFVVEWHASAGAAFAWLKRNVPQAVLMTRATPASEAQKVVIASRRSKKLHRTPVLSLGSDYINPKLDTLAGMGETLLLHAITLAEALRRLKLAIELKQILS